MANESLSAAKAAKNDEFYTQYHYSPGTSEHKNIALSV